MTPMLLPKQFKLLELFITDNATRFVPYETIINPKICDETNMVAI